MKINLKLLETIYSKYTQDVTSKKISPREASSILHDKVQSWAKKQKPAFIIGRFSIDGWMFGTNHSDVILVTDEKYMYEWDKIDAHKPVLTSMWKKFCFRKNVVRIYVTLYDDAQTTARIRSTYEC